MAKKKRPSTRLAKQILFSKYGKRCMICEREFEKKYLQYHHIVEFSKGGATDVENGAILCPNCHNMLHRGNEKAFNKKIREYKVAH